MSEQPNWRRYLRFWGPDVKRDIEDELAFHLAMRERDLVARGRTEVEAKREAKAAFGDLDAIELELRAMNVRHQKKQRRLGLLEEAWSDLRQAGRAFRQRPGLPAVIVLTVALAIGSATTVFTLFDAVLLNPVAVRAPDELVSLQDNKGIGGIPYPVLRALRERATTLQGLTAHAEQSVAVREGQRAERLTASVVGGDFFNVLGVIPWRGRLLLPDDEAKAAQHAIVSEGLWKRWFGDAAVDGQAIDINGQKFTVVGVAPSRFRGTQLSNPVDVWIPVTAIRSIANGGLFSANVLEAWNFNWLSPVARLKPGVALESAVAELRTLHRVALETGRSSEADSFMPQEAPPELDAIPLVEAAAARSRADLVQFMTVLAGVVAICLAIACLNVANLLVMRFIERRRELSVRMAIGARPGRILRQLLLENATLALAAGTLGVVVAVVSLRLLTSFDLPGGISLVDLNLELNSRVLAFTLVVSMFCALGFGFGPALFSARMDPLTVLHGNRKREFNRWRGGPSLVFVQVTLSIVLLVSAALFLRSLQSALRVELGYSSAGVASASVGLRQSGYTSEQAQTFFREALDNARARPGISQVAFATRVPINPNSFAMPMQRADTKEKLRPLAINAVTPEYFDVLSIPVVQGRGLEWTDTRDSDKAGLITEDAARLYWPGENVIGRQLQIFPPFGPTVTIVGVVRAGHYSRLTETTPHLFLSILQETGFGAMDEAMLVGRGANADAVLAGLRATLREIDQALPIFNEQNVDQRLAAVMMPQRLGSLLLAGFGAIALLICAVGIYAVVSYDVTRRNREFGIRLALGAAHHNLVEAVLGRSGIAIAAGTATGLILAAASTSAIRKLLFGIQPYEAVSYLSAAALFGLIALLACWAPARRALRTDPLRVIRESD